MYEVFTSLGAGIGALTLLGGFAFYKMQVLKIRFKNSIEKNKDLEASVSELQEKNRYLETDVSELQEQNQGLTQEVSRQNIIALCAQVKSFDLEADQSQRLKEEMRYPFGGSTTSFVKILQEFLQKDEGAFGLDDKLWALIESYVIKESSQALQEIEHLLIEAKKDLSFSQTFLLNIDKELIKNLYLTQDVALIDVFSRHCPIPSIIFFKGGLVPKFILEREQEAKAYLSTLNDKSFLKHVLYAQRVFRFRKHQETKARTQSLSSDANMPYIPEKCLRGLSDRIFLAAEKVCLAKKASYITSESDLPSLLEDGICSKRNTIELYVSQENRFCSKIEKEIGEINFVRLNLARGDVFAGEMPENKALEIKFSLGLVKKNPAASFRLLNFLLPLQKKKTLSIGDYNLCFKLSGAKEERHGFYSKFTLYGENQEVIDCSFILNDSLNATNIEQLNKILVLNFFRFIDGLSDTNNTAKIYDAFNLLDPQTLASTMQNLIEVFAGGAQLGFLRAYKIDYRFLESISSVYVSKEDRCRMISSSNIKTNYTLDMGKLLKAWKHKEENFLAKARENLPALFENKNFIEYLDTKTPANIRRFSQ